MRRLTLFWTSFLLLTSLHHFSLGSTKILRQGKWGGIIAAASSPNSDGSEPSEESPYSTDEPTVTVTNSDETSETSESEGDPTEFTTEDETTRDETTSNEFTTDEFNSTTTEIATSSSSEPPSRTCDCNLMQIELDEPETTDLSFNVSFWISSSIPSECVDEVFTRIKLDLYGPFNQDYIPPSSVQTLQLDAICFNVSANGRYSFNSTNICRNRLNVYPCSNYTLSITPAYSTCPFASVPENTTFSTRLGIDSTPAAVTVLETGSDWVHLSWDDSIWCQDAITGYSVSLLKTPNFISSDEQIQNVPLECVNRTMSSTFLDTRECPNLFALQPCGRYYVSIQVQTLDNQTSDASPRQEFTTIPPNDLESNIDSVESGSNWISFKWNLSSSECQASLTGLRLNLMDSSESNQIALDLAMDDCTSLVNDQEKSYYLFNTSSCAKPLAIASCSVYKFELTPQIFDVYYDEYLSSTSGSTAYDANATVIIQALNVGPEWISFNWTSSVPECRASISGFYLSISTEQSSPSLLDPNFYISMAKCYPDLPDDQDIPFNTSTACECWGGGTDIILPCTDYSISILPEFYGTSVGTENLTLASTPPGGNLSLIVNSTVSGKTWISIRWRIVQDSCNIAITGYQIDIIPNPFVNQTDWPRKIFTCTDTTQDEHGFITTNTTGPCFPDLPPLLPCLGYDFHITPEIAGHLFGDSTFIFATTTPGSDAYAVISEQQSGVDWLSFQWGLPSSIQRCWSAVSQYQITFKDTVSGDEQTGYYSKYCTSTSPNFPNITFNSSLVENCYPISILPCTNYSLALIPEFLLNSIQYFGVSTPTVIGTKSGEGGNIKAVNVTDQGIHSIEMQWIEPMCKTSAILEYYNVIVNAAWTGPEARNMTLKIDPQCLQSSNDSSDLVTLTLNNSACNNPDFELISCAPYDIFISPFYKLESANGGILNAKISSQTLPDEDEASVTNLQVLDSGSRWFFLSWTPPVCQLPILNWRFEEIELGIPVTLPANCPNNMQDQLNLNITNEITCSDGSIYTFGIDIAPCSNYTIRLDVEFPGIEIQQGSSNTISATSLVEPPGEVKQLKSRPSNDSVLITWSPPDVNPQCVSSYQLNWNLTEESTYTLDTHFSISNLIPCKELLVTVTALSEIEQLNVVQRSAANITASTSAVEPDPTPYINVSFVNESKRNITWQAPDPGYCISGYYVSIYERDSMLNPFYNTTNEGKDNTSLTLSQEAFPQGQPYTISVASYSRFNNAVNTGNTTLKEFYWDSASDMLNIVVIVVVIIFSLLMVALGVFLFVIWRRRGRQKTVLPFTPVENVKEKQAIQKPNKILTSRKIVTIGELTKRIDILEANLNEELNKEFEQVKELSSKWEATSSVAALPENRDKNRYSDILPYDHSRVKLNLIPNGPSHLDYINASYVAGFDGNRNYIATQGPKVSTLNDFWRMCFEQDVRVIVALTLMEEKGRIKCAQYWPNQGTACYGDIQVKLMEEIHLSSHSVRDFSVGNFAKPWSVPKFVRQLHFIDWPDFGCPENPEMLVSFIHTMRSQSNALTSLTDPYHKFPSSPILVHCSAGVGRTGTLIALDILMDQARRRRAVDVLGTVVKIRKYRAGLVQTEKQYHFLYKSIEAYVKSERLTDHPLVNSALLYSSTETFSNVSSPV